MERSPQYAGSFYDLVRCRRIGTADAALVGRMEAAAARPGLHAEARVKLHLALGKAADDLGDPGEAMRQFDLAGALRGGGDADGRAVEVRVDRLIDRFGAQRLARASETGHPDGTAVLVVGLPRSGTTLVEQILSCHPDVHPGGELPFWTERTALVDEQDAGRLARAGANYADLLHGLAPAGIGRVTDKMPLNVFQVGLIHLCLPRAMIVSCRRRPIDVALSIHRTYFNRDIALPTRGAALVAAVRAIERLSAHWRQVLPAAQLHEVDYERLVSEPGREIAALLSACRLSWNEACLHPERNPRVVRTPSRWQVRQPITPPLHEAWRRYEPWLGALAALL